MSNSSLVSYTKLSPNNSGTRTHSIDTLTIHCVAGNMTVEGLGALFADSSRQASSNYGIGSDGRIGLYVDESKRSWCSSSRSNDQRAITIEVANCGGADEGWPVTTAAYNALISLLVDICQRNGIEKLVWSTNKEDRINHLNGCNMTVHRDFANKSCPGEWLYSRHGQIANEVNAALSGASAGEDEEEVTQEQFNEMMATYLQEQANKDATWEKDAMEWAVAEGLFVGDDQGRLMPKSYLTRGQFATVMKRMAEKA